MDQVIAVKDLKKVYDRTQKTAVAGVSFEVERGQCFGFIGPNGAGKSTTLEMLQGLKKPSAGSIELFGMPWQGNEKKLRRRIAGVLQENEMYARLKVVEAVRLFASFYPDYQAIDEVLEQFNLTQQRNNWLCELSGGQRQRVFLAMAVVGKPEIIFLDEPTTGLDPTSRQEFWEILNKLKADGVTLILTSHYMDEVEFLCDTLAIIDKGTIIESGSPQDIIHRTFAEPVIKEPRNATLNDVFLKLTGFDLSGGMA